METIGTRLRKAREKKGLTLEDVKKTLKIHLNILKALEEDNAHKSLNPIYARSFLKTYARYLGLNDEKIIEEYTQGHKEKPEQILYLSPKEEMLSYHIKRYLPLISRIIVVILTLVLMIFAVKNLVKFTKVRMAGRTHRVKVVKKVEKKKTKTETRKKELPARKAEEDALIVPSHQPLNLIVKASDNVWMQIKSDGEVIFSNILSKGSVETWNAKESIELWVGNAGALDFTLNGIKLGSPGRGVKRGILITHKGMKLP